MNKAKQGWVFRDDKERMGIKIGSKIVELKGDIDCEYRGTQLIKVKTTPWKGKSPVKPLQELGIISGDNLEKALKADGKYFGSKVEGK